MVHGVPQPELGGDPIIEPLENGKPSVRSGVAVMPSSSTGATWLSNFIGGSGSVVELVDDDYIEVLGPRCEVRALRLWTDAKTCSKLRWPAPPTHFSPKLGSRRA